MNLTLKALTRVLLKCDSLFTRSRNQVVSVSKLEKKLLLPRKYNISLCLHRDVYASNNCFAKVSINCNPICQFSTSNQNEIEKPNNKPTLYQRFKLMYKEYWYVLLPVHLATSAMWLGGFYYLATTGVDIATLLEVSGAPSSWVETMRESKAGGIVTAYTMYKIATPARYTVTLGGTTISINYLKKWGWIQPMPSTEQLKEIYDKGKSALKDKMVTTKDEIKDEFAKTTNEISQHMKEAKSGFTQSVAETKEGLKEGVREAADEWRHVGKLIKRNVKEMTKSPKSEK